jgi:hypothetical protein
MQGEETNIMKRKASDARIRKAWRKLKNVAAVARRIGYSHAGTYRALHRLGIK